MTASTRRCVSTAALVVLALASTLPARAQTPDDIYAAAKSEGAFVLYVGGPTAPWEATARIFEQRYPGIKVAITGGFSNVLDKKIDQQIKDGRLEVDTAIFQTLQDFVRWKAEGQLLAYKPPGFRRHRSKLQGRRGRVLRRDGERHALHVQHRARRRG